MGEVTRIDRGSSAHRRAAPSAKRDQVETTSLVLRDECQCRAAVSQEAVDEYAEAYRSGAELPPLRVCRVPDVGLVVTDGFHRLAGAIAADVGWLVVEVTEGETLHDAVWQSLAANKGHGLRRTNADKRKAVTLALEHPDGPELSDRMLAEHCGVSDKTVAEVRRELRNFRSSPEPEVRVGRDGKRRAVSPAPRQVRTVRTSDVVEEGEPRQSAPPPKTKQEAISMQVAAWQTPYRVVADALRAARLATREQARSHEHASNRLLRLAEQIGSLEQSAKDYAPTVCPQCSGAGCGACRSAGWLEENQARVVRRGQR